MPALHAQGLPAHAAQKGDLCLSMATPDLTQHDDMHESIATHRFQQQLVRLTPENSKDDFGAGWHSMLHAVTVSLCLLSVL